MTTHDVYDIECLSNLFTYTGYDYDHDEWRQFVVCAWRNDIGQLMDYLKNLKSQVGFNNRAYDYPLLHFIMNTDFTGFEGQGIANEIYAMSQKVINAEFPEIRKERIRQVDLFKIWHFDNKATSLKDLKFAMRMENVEEMPIHHSDWCKEGDEELILEYNRNDVLATFRFLLITLGKTDNPLYKGKNKIELRQRLKRKFGIDCLNSPDVRIGEALVCHLYAKETGIPEYRLRRQGGTPRNHVDLKDCIPRWCHFETKEFNSIKEKFEKATITNLKGEFSDSVIFHGCKMDYGQGGLHSCIRPGIYDADDYWMILDEDVGSLYPSLAITLGLYPEHLGPAFTKVYDENIVSIRMAEKRKPKEERDMVIMEGYKLAANGTYGKSGEETSPLYDPLFTMKTTIGGQMFISMWTEKLVKAIPEIRFLQHNTDGITYMLPRKDLDKAKGVAKEMSEITGLYIEDNTYRKFVVMNVNSYIAMYEDGHCKLKGCFEIDKELHKDSSMRIVPIALHEYFVNGKPIKETIMNHRDIFDFCLRLKVGGKCSAKLERLEDGEIKTVTLGRTTRYYVSNNGGRLYKEFDDGRISNVNVGYGVTLFNKYVGKPMDEYDINYQFYVTEAYKIKNAVNDGQLSLF